MNDPYASDASVVGKHGLLVFNLVDLFNYGEMQSHIRSLSYGPEISHAGTAAAPSNIVAIQVESLYAFIVDTKYNNAFIMPFLHDLSYQCIYYPFMMSYHEAGSTSDCEFSTLNSVEPFGDVPSIKVRNYGYPNSVVKQFAAQGYGVEAYHGNRGTYFNRAAAFKRAIEPGKMGLGIFYVNDSKATTPLAAQLAIEAFSRPVIVIAGGYDKHADPTPMALTIRARAKAAILMGATARAVAGGIGQGGPPVEMATGIDDAVRRAVAHAAPGDVVLLSPGHASWDMFENYEQRGQQFIDLVDKVIR